MAKKDKGTKKKAKADKKATKDETSLMQDAKRIWLAGLGAAVRAQKGDTKLFDELAETGSDYLAERSKSVRSKFETLRDDVVDWFESTREDVGSRIDERISESLDRFGVPSASTFEQLTSKVEALTRRLEEMEANGGAAAGPDVPRVHIEVAPHADGWQVSADRETVAVHRTKGPAVAAARDLANSRAPSELVVRKGDGSEQDRNTYDG
jgi:poly(hydroxyalkanoate) granule-associated protein